MVQTLSGGLVSLAISSTAFLMFLRVRAVFNRNSYVVAFFAFMWIAVLGGSLTAIPGAGGANIGPTNYCVVTKAEPYLATAALIPLVNDTLLFLAISWRLMKNTHMENSIQTRFRILAFGEYLLPFSKALLQDGQVYYL